MNIYTSKVLPKCPAISITGSKSESNRLLLLQALFPELRITNLSNSDDVIVMQKALKNLESNKKQFTVDVHHAGTAMRFLTAYFATVKDIVVEITGSSRMKQRPIGILVDALRALGAQIEYLEKEGFPPLKIKGKSLEASSVALQANVSSQYISALLLVASKLKNGLSITLNGAITSKPYINMTLALLNAIGVSTRFEAQNITVEPFRGQQKELSVTVESDWSSASYWYSIIALSAVGTQVQLSAYKKETLQGDAVLVSIYKQFGVETRFNKDHIVLRKSRQVALNETIVLDLTASPDIAQTIAVTAFGLGLSCHLIGLHTLKIKETDRLIALKTELEKFGAEVVVTDSTLGLSAATQITSNVTVATYNDHRMAMAFAPLALLTDIKMQDPDVVSKSYPDFWRDLKTVGFLIETQKL